MKRLVLLFLALTLQVQAAEQESSTSVDVGNRSDRRFGAYLSALGDSATSGTGVNVAYNANDFLRLHLGYGQSITSMSAVITNTSISVASKTMTTIGLGAKAMLPGKNLTPVAGLGLGFNFGDSGSSTSLYSNIGADWQAKSGFNVGAGLNLAMAGPGSTGPYANVGWFF